MEYNTQQKKIPLPEYGRSIQNMVDHALTLEDRAERQRCANTIVNIMGGMFPHLRDVPDFKHKLWDHLAIMSGFQLDIDYPYEIIKVDKLYTKPEVIPYPRSRIRYRHYGRMLETLISRAIDFPEGEEKKHLIALIANHMRKSFITWNKETVDEEKIFDDLVEYTEGAIRPGEDTLKLMSIRMAMHRHPRPAGGQHTNHSPHNNNHYNNQRRHIK
ncbi:MAG: DUF4290 domain-containing protein [Bacteroides sp.]|nr:DUF4290 domain-containing protein [Bacteroides sp.]